MSEGRSAHARESISGGRQCSCAFVYLPAGAGRTACGGGKSPAQRACARHFRKPQKAEKAVDAHAGIADEAPERAGRKLFVLRHGEIGPVPLFAHHGVTSDLPDNTPTGLPESLCRLFPGDIGELCRRLHRDDHLVSI